MDTKGKVLIGLGVAGLLYLIFKSQSKITAIAEDALPMFDNQVPPPLQIAPQRPAHDPDYRKGMEEVPIYTNSSDDYGGTLFTTEGPIGSPIKPRIDRGGSGARRKMPRVAADQGYYNYPVPTGGTFVNPRVLPPLREARLQ